MATGFRKLTKKEIDRMEHLGDEIAKFTAIWKENPGWVPTIKDADLARLVKLARHEAWNPATRQNW
jgi:hypothetical protein